MIDADGYRLNVGIILINQAGQLFWGKRAGMEDAWQFPQGGIQENETPETAMYRELTEELGLLAEHVEIIAESPDWMTYHLPKKFRRYDTEPLCIGQKQKWFLLRLTAEDSCIKLDTATKPEFDQWAWVDKKYPAQHVILFKRDVYQRILKIFEKYLD